MGDIEWFYPEKGKGVDASINDIISHIPGVEREIQQKARSMGSEAWLQLLWHHQTGAAAVEVTQHPRASARTPDWYVYLKDADPGGKWRNSTGKGKAVNIPDRSVMSIEFGWIQTHVYGKKLKKPIKHDGLDILGSVMRRAAGKYRGGK